MKILCDCGCGREFGQSDGFYSHHGGLYFTACYRRKFLGEKPRRIRRGRR